MVKSLVAFCNLFLFLLLYITQYLSNCVAFEKQPAFLLDLFCGFSTSGHPDGCTVSWRSLAHHFTTRWSVLSFLIKKSAFLDSHQLHSALCNSFQAPHISVHAASWHISNLIRSEPPAKPLTLTSFYMHNWSWSTAAKIPCTDNCSCLGLKSSPTQMGRDIRKCLAVMWHCVCWWEFLAVARSLSCESFWGYPH